MPSVDPDKDYEVVHEDSSDDGFQAVTVTVPDNADPVDVHVYARREDRDSYERVRGFTLCGPPSYDNLETTVGIPIEVDNNRVLVYTDVRVEANGDVDDVELEERT